MLGMFLCYATPNLYLEHQTFRASSTTHGRVVSVFIFSKFTLSTLELPFVVIAYNCPERCANNYV